MFWQDHFTSVFSLGWSPLHNNKPTSRKAICKLGESCRNRADPVEARGAVMGSIWDQNEDLEALSIIRTRLVDV